MNRDWGVLLLAHGAPDRLEDVPAFVLSLRDGRPLPPSALDEIVERYRVIGGGSPLLPLTLRQAAALERRLGRRVYVGMRNWRPYIADAIRQAHQEGAERLVALCLAPQNSRTSVGLYRKCLREAVERLAPSLEVDFIESWHSSPGLIAAFRERVIGALERAASHAAGATPIIFAAHSVPERTIAAGDPYDRQVRETAARVEEALGGERNGVGECRVAYQSQGQTPEPWIGPTVESQIDALALAGHRRCVIAPIGFVCDHVEILFDIDVAFKKYAAGRGVVIFRSESLNDSPLLIETLAALVTERVRQAA